MKDDLTQQKESFNDRAENYYMSRNGDKQLLLRNLLYKELLKDINICKKKIMVLEPMCGYGEGKRILENLFGSAISYEGFDYSDEIVKYAAKYHRGGVNIYVQDVTTFSTDKKYDIIIILGGLHHVPAYSAEVVRNMSGLLNKDGIFINVEPTYNNKIFKYLLAYIYKKNKNFDEKTERRFSLNELNDIYLSNGLKIKRQMYPGLLAYLLWNNPNAFPLLNKGSTRLVKIVFHLDKLFMHNRIGKWLSVATFSVLKK